MHYADDDYCTSNPCMNGAVCRPLSGGFSCNPCALNVTGARCEFGAWNIIDSHINSTLSCSVGVHCHAVTF